VSDFVKRHGILFITLELSVPQEFWSIFRQFAVRLMGLRSGDELEHQSYLFHGLDIARPLEFRHTSFPKLGLFHRLV
jgi:hypothetical protein